VPFQKVLGAFPGKGLQEDRPRVEERHHEEGDLPFLTGQPDRRFAEGDLRLARRMGQRQEDLLVRLLPIPDRVHHDGQLPLTAMFVPQAFKDRLAVCRCLRGALRSSIRI
jgi:hypothetical protein